MVKKKYPGLCPKCERTPCQCPSGGIGDAEKPNHTQHVLHAIVYVWLGGPVPETLRRKMSHLKNKGHKIYLLHDLEDTSRANDSLVAIKKIGANLIRFDKELLITILLDHGFDHVEIDILWQAYLHQFYGHSLGPTTPPDPACRNFAAAADIVRLIGLLEVRKIAPSEIHHCLYSDHDVTPLARMMQPASRYGLQLHQFRWKFSLVGQGDVVNPGLGLNNAVIRLERECKEFDLISRSLKLIIKRYSAFFSLTAENQQRCMHKLSGLVRVMMTLFLSGPHIFETLKWHQQNDDDFLWTFLYDTAEDDSEADFENTSTRTWATPYQPTVYSEYALLYLLSFQVHGLLKDSEASQLEFKIKPQLKLATVLRSMDFPEASIGELSKSHDLDTFLFADLEGAKMFAAQNPDNSFFQLADIDNEASRKALFVQLASTQPNLDEASQLELSLLNPAVTSGRDANCFFQSFMHVFTLLSDDTLGELLQNKKYQKPLQHFVNTFNQSYQGFLPKKFSLKEIIQLSKSLHPLDREFIFGPVLRQTYNALVSAQLIQTEPLGYGEHDIVLAHQTIAFANCFGACLSVYMPQDEFTKAQAGNMPPEVAERILEHKVNVGSKIFYCDRSPDQPTVWTLDLVFAGIHLNYTLGSPKLNQHERDQVVIGPSTHGSHIAYNPTDQNRAPLFCANSEDILRFRMAKLFQKVNASLSLKPQWLANASLFRGSEDKFLERHRHDDPRLQQEYDKRFGLILS